MRNLGKAFSTERKAHPRAFDHFSENVGDEDTGKDGDHMISTWVFVIFWSNVDEFNTMDERSDPHPPI